MSWVDKIQNELIITTGDSEQYKPAWLNASYDKEYNITQFDFPKLKGTLVRRNEPMGRKLTLEIYFTGADHLDVAAAFSNSADDKRPWKLEHPYYSILYVQPLSINVNNSDHNVSKITIPVMETILEDAPKVNPAPVETIALKKVLLDEVMAQSLTAEIQPVDVTAMTENNRKMFNLAIPVFKIPEEFTKYVDLFNKANAAINKATQFPLDAMRTITTLISYPAKLSQSVKSRVGLLVDQFNTLRATVEGITGVSGKQVYQNSAGSIISTLAVAASTPSPGDYKSSIETIETMDTILEAYNNFIADLDLLQGDNGGSPDSYIPDPAAIIALSSLVSLTVSSLFSIALSAKKERSIITEFDTNWIILTHRLYGLDPTDDNLTELMDNNNVGLNELLLVKKGRKVIYYI